MTPLPPEPSKPKPHRSRWVIRWGLVLERGSAAWKWAVRTLGRIKPGPKPPHPPAAFLTMYDSIDVKAIPARAEAAGGYVGGKWPTFHELPATIPHRLSIAVTSAESADCLDVERFDATPAQAPGWLKGPLAKNAATLKPVLYSSRDAWPALTKTLEAAGIPRSSYLVWSAHYTGKPHLCGAASCGATVEADATQWTDKALGRNLDASLVKGRGFFRP